MKVSATKSATSQICQTLAETRQENFDNIKTFDLTKIVSLLKSLSIEKQWKE
jgi:hypothetical protein